MLEWKDRVLLREQGRKMRGLEYAKVEGQSVIEGMREENERTGMC